VFYQHLEQNTVKRLQNRVMGHNQYLIKGKGSFLNEKWRLYVPTDFKEHLRGIKMKRQYPFQDLANEHGFNPRYIEKACRISDILEVYHMYHS